MLEQGKLKTFLPCHLKVEDAIMEKGIKGMGSQINLNTSSEEQKHGYEGKADFLVSVCVLKITTR